MKKASCVLLILCILLCAGCGKQSKMQGKAEGNKPEASVEQSVEIEAPEEEIPEDGEIPIFCTKSIDSLENEGLTDITDYYITNRVTALNHYYIDENAVLWGNGQNSYGQLGNGEVAEAFDMTPEPVWIAENVVSVDCSGNGYFTIYLTADGKLYGMGANILGLFGKDGIKTAYSAEEYDKVPVPVLLMEDVAYAKAGREAIVALKNDGSVWWWGQYRSVYLTEAEGYENFWMPYEDEKNAAKMLYNSPKKILDDCAYVTTGDWTGAAISKNGELYTWGLNVFGECGVPITEDDYVRTPQKVLEDVRMVWVEEVKFNDLEQEIPEMAYLSTNYIMNVFAQLENGEILAAGQNIGYKEKTIEMTGDLPQESTHIYSDSFIPVEIVDEKEMVSNIISEIEVGRDMSEVSDLLEKKGIQPSLGYYPNPFGEPGQDINVLMVPTAEGEIRLLFDEDGKFQEVLNDE